MTRRLSVLGSTGSVGTSTLEVVRHHPGEVEVVALAAFGSRVEPLIDQIREMRPRLVAVFDRERAREVAAAVGGEVEVAAGEEGLLRAATLPEADRVVAAMVGAAGLPAVHAALAAGKDVALANKESMVVAGPLLNRLAAETGGRILPVDSEHAALHQALRCGTEREVRRLVLTASGGPFRTRDRATWDEITPEEARAHPTWEMGAKISVDSATLMNKALELIEASYLFGLPPDRIDVVVHPQSIVHSLVEYVDGSWIGQLSVNDMVFPIQYAIAYPERWANDFSRLDPGELGSLDFQPLDRERFPTVDLARRALAAGPSATALLNAANEVAVHAFLDRRIRFPQIFDICRGVLEDHRAEEVADLDRALHWDRAGREAARRRIDAGVD